MLTRSLQSLRFRQVANLGLRCLHPSLAMVVARDALGWRSRAESSRRHLDATMQWLCRAQDAAGGTGVSAGFSLTKGWWPPYPETTGYIIPTFFDYARLTRKEEYHARACRMAEWEIHLQLPSGAIQAGVFRGPGRPRHPAVFNTGQVILGWCRTYQETGSAVILEAAHRAGNWLVEIQRNDGCWELAGPETETTVHAYDVRTAWSLLELQRLTQSPHFLDAAKRNLEWTLSQQRENGWFDSATFFITGEKWSLPFTHTIAYVLEGLLEAWKLVGDIRYLQATQRTAERLMRVFEIRRFMPGEFDSSWGSSATYSCLTGNAQIAGVWMQLYEATGDIRLLNAALKLNDYVKETQALRSVHPGVRGGIKASHPIFGRYTPLMYINWGAKFFADSLMLEDKIMASLETAVASRDRSRSE